MTKSPFEMQQASQTARASTDLVTTPMTKCQQAFEDHYRHEISLQKRRFTGYELYEEFTTQERWSDWQASWQQAQRAVFDAIELSDNVIGLGERGRDAIRLAKELLAHGPGDSDG